MAQNLVLAIDIGTTNCRVGIVNKEGTIIKLASRPIHLKSPRKGWFEICPDELWNDVSSLIKEVSSNYKNELLTCGISVQRNTFITWNKDTGKHLHNFITWMDMRSTKMCNKWNNSYFISAAQWAAWVLGSIVRSRHIICASTFSVKEKAIQMRLKWVMENINGAKMLANSGKLRFGTIETWLIWKLTGGRTWATDYSCASGTGIFDIWKKCWCPIMTFLFSNPLSILPEVRDSNSHFGDIEKDLGFGFSIPITGVLGDQQASIFGNLLFDIGDVKLTLGTGIACNINTGSKTHPTSHNIYPLIGWKLSGLEPFYVAELLAANGGRAVDWVVTSGLINTIQEIDQVARSVPNSAGVSFVPAFNGMEVPYRDPFAGTSLFGISLSTKVPNIVRAVLESQTFISQYVLNLVFEYYGKPDKVRVDGGASQSLFIIENIVNLSDISIERAKCVEGSLLGASFMAGLGIGLYRDLRDIRSNVLLELNTHSNRSDEGAQESIRECHDNWCKSAEKCVDWTKTMP